MLPTFCSRPKYNGLMPAKNIIRHQKVSKAKLARAKELRSKMTPAEAVLWRELRRIPFPPHFGVLPKWGGRAKPGWGWACISDDNRSFRDISWTSIVTRLA